MKTFYSLSIIVFLVFSVSSCKKDAKSQMPVALLGKWYIRQYTITTTTNDIAGSPYVYFSSDTGTNVYYQFNGDGTGFENNNFDPAYISIPPAKFNYKVSGSNITFSQVSATLQSATCSFEIPTSTTLIIRSSYKYTDSFGNVINSLQVLNLDK